MYFSDFKLNVFQISAFHTLSLLHFPLPHFQRPLANVRLITVKRINRSQVHVISAIAAFYDAYSLRFYSTLHNLSGCVP